MSEETPEYWRGYRDAMEQMRGVMPAQPINGCVCSRPWMGVVPPYCPTHTPVRMNYCVTSTTNADEIAAGVRWELRNVA